MNADVFRGLFAWAACTAFALSWPTAHAGQIDAGAYVVTYDDAMGTPDVGTDGEWTTYTFAGLSLGDTGDGDHPEPSVLHAGPVDVIAAPGFWIASRPDTTFPVHSELHVSEVVPPSSPGPIYPYDNWTAAAGFSTTDAESAIVWYGESCAVSYDDPNGGSCSQGHSANVIPDSFTDRATATFEASVTTFWGGGSATFTPVVYIDDRYITTAVPEPASVALLLAGLCVLAPRMRGAARASLAACALSSIAAGKNIVPLTPSAVV